MLSQPLSTWALILGLAAVALLPLLAVGLRRGGDARGRREADIALYRAQLAELDREREAGRLDAPAHRAATLEVQRRLLAAPEEGVAATRLGGRGALLAALGLLPLLAILVYRLTGVPDMPSVPYAERRAVAERDEALLANLRTRLAGLDQGSEAARAGYALLGNAERGRDRPEAAVAAYRASLAAGFDAAVAGQLAQVLLELNRTEEARSLLADALPRAPRDIGLRFLGGLAEARAGAPERARLLWQALIADAPPDAPWRAMVQRRMAELP